LNPEKVVEVKTGNYHHGGKEELVRTSFIPTVHPIKSQYRHVSPSQIHKRHVSPVNVHSRHRASQIIVPTKTAMHHSPMRMVH